MRDGTGYQLWTYRSGDGRVTEQVFNPVTGGDVPQFITGKDGVTVLALDPASASYRGRGWNPPAGMRSVVPWTPPSGGAHGETALGWPGMTTVA